MSSSKVTMQSKIWTDAFKKTPADPVSEAAFLASDRLFDNSKTPRHEEIAEYVVRMVGEHPKMEQLAALRRVENLDILHVVDWSFMVMIEEKGCTPAELNARVMLIRAALADCYFED